MFLAIEEIQVYLEDFLSSIEMANKLYIRWFHEIMPSQ